MKYYIERISSITAGIIFLQTLFYKFSAAPESVYIFSTLGMEPYGRIGLGIAELIVAVLLLFRKTSVVGAVLGLGVISGALVSHLFVIGIEVQGDKGALFALALIVFVCCLLSLFLRKDDVKKLVHNRSLV